MSDEDIARSTKDSVAPAKDPMTDAFSLLSKHLDNALEQQKKEIFSVLETKILALNSSNTSKTEFKFKYTSNQKQCAVSDKVFQDISAIITAIVADNRELAIKTVDKVQIDIVVRNKTAKIGDKHGWDTVNEYEGNPLADDSDDERHLRQAETRAINKRKAATPKEPPKRMATDKLFRCLEPNLHLDYTTRGKPLSLPPQEKS